MLIYMSRFLTGYSLNNLLETLGISQNNDITDLNNFKITTGISTSNLNNLLNTYQILTATSTSNLQNTDNFLQTQINSIVSAGISAGNVDIAFAVSITVLDNFKGLQGITNTSFTNSTNALNVSSSNLNNS